MRAHALYSSRIFRGLVWTMLAAIPAAAAWGQEVGGATGVAAGRIVTVCNSGMVIRSNDGGRTWERLGPVDARNAIEYVGQGGVSAGALAAHGGTHPAAWASPSITSGPFVISVFTVRSGPVDVVVCGTAGAIVAKWSDAERGPGLRRIPCDAGDLPAGRYFYRIVSGGSAICGDSFVVAR